MAFLQLWSKMESPSALIVFGQAAPEVRFWTFLNDSVIAVNVVEHLTARLIDIKGEAVSSNGEFGIVRSNRYRVRIGCCLIL